MNPYCNPLNFKCQILLKEKLLDTLKLKYDTIVLMPNAFLHHDFIQIFQDKGLVISHLESFYSQENFIMPIHMDKDSNNDMTKINFIWGGLDSYMSWYKIKDTSIPASYLETHNKTGYLSYPESNLDHMFSMPVHSPSLVQVGLPHNITNFSQKRLCLSIVFKDKNFNNITMTKALELFKEYLAPEARIELATK